VWNATIDRKPAAAGVGFARETGIALAIKGGGHDISGLAVADGSLVLDLSLRREARPRGPRQPVAWSSPATAATSPRRRGSSRPGR
jgi:hypothetical protein